MVPLTGFAILTTIPPVYLGPCSSQHKGGTFQIHPCVDGVNQKQFYWPETNILVTRFLAECGFAEVIELHAGGAIPEDRGYHWLVRQVRGIRCNMTFRLRCQPAFNYARDSHQVEVDEHGAMFHSASLNLALVSTLPPGNRWQGGVDGVHHQTGAGSNLCAARTG